MRRAVDGLARGQAADRRVAGRLDGLGLVVELLVQALAGTGADDLDLDVLARPQSREADHLPRELDDADGLAHLEHEDLAVVGHRAGLEHEAHGFGDRHEVTRHLGVGHGDRTALDDLTEERRDDAAAAAEHVAEPHRGERQVVLVARPRARRAPRRAWSRPSPSTGRRPCRSRCARGGSGVRRRCARASASRARCSVPPRPRALRGAARACAPRRGTRRRVRSARRSRAGASRRGCRRAPARPCRASRSSRRAGSRHGRAAAACAGP